MRKFLLGLVLMFGMMTSGAFAQSTSTFVPYPSTCSGVLFAVQCQTIYTFDNAYWLSQPVPVQNLWALAVSLNPTAPRNVLAQQLAVSGYTVDVPIMVWGWDPYLTMLTRTTDGLSWVPSATQGSGGGTGAVPAGAIKVDDNAADYAPVVPPAPPVVTTGCAAAILGDLGFQINGQEAFGGAATLPFPNGTLCNTPNGSFVADLLGSDLMSPTQRTEVWLKQQ